jgi:hypothetical protein
MDAMTAKRQRQTARRRARQTKAATVPRYLPDLVALGRACGPGVHFVTTLHDPDCPMLHGGSHCACDPVVRYGTPDGRGRH